MSIESHLVSLRTYLEEVSSQNRQILAELKRINVEPKGGQGGKSDAFIDAVTQDTVSKPKTQDKPATKQAASASVEKQLEAETGKDFVKTGSNPVTLAETDKSASTAKKGKKGGTVKPAVNWNS